MKRLSTYFISIQIIVVLMSTIKVHAQDTKKDSLLKIWNNKSLHDTIRVQALHSVARDIFLNLNEDSCIYYSQIEYEFAKAKGLKLNMANAMTLMGIVYMYSGRSSKALSYFKHSLPIYLEMGYKRGIGAMSVNIGGLYFYNNDYINALKYYKEGLVVFREINDKPFIANSLGNIGSIYYQQEEYKKSIDYAQMALDIHQELGNDFGISLSLINLSEAYFELKNYDKAMGYAQRALKITEDNSLDNFSGKVMGIIGNIYLLQGDLKKAILWNEKGNKIAKKNADIKSQIARNKSLYEAYKKLGKEDIALSYLEKNASLNDTLKKEESLNQLQKMEFDKEWKADSLKQVELDKQAEEKLQNEVQKKNNSRITMVISAIVLLILSYILFNRLKSTRKSKAALQEEKDLSENLLLNILPAEIAEELKKTGKAEARNFDMISILFTDFVGFTKASTQMTPEKLVEEINVCFEEFDRIIEKFEVEKIKTIGDAYMAAGGLPVPNNDSIKNTVLAALEMQDFIINRKALNDSVNKPSFEMRVGIHTGSVVAGIVGIKKFQYDIWGDTVNTASRIESNGQSGKVNISQTTYELIKDDPDFVFESRGKIDVKGKGEMEMYFVRSLEV